MCGIIGYTGPLEAPRILLDGLSCLEYRGYDSAGIALCMEDSKISLFKKNRLRDLLIAGLAILAGQHMAVLQM